MRLLANLPMSRQTFHWTRSEPSAFVTPTDGGCILTIVMCINTQRLVGGYVERPGREAYSALRLHQRLVDLARRLSCDHARLLEVAAHVRDAARSLERALGKAGCPGKLPLSIRQLQVATAMLSADLTSSVCTRSVASKCGLSESHFRRAFRGCTGLSPMEWRQAMRLQRSRQQLIASSAPLSVIGREAGFKVQSHFSRVFSRSTGTTPSEWRRLFRGEDCSYLGQQDDQTRRRLTMAAHP